MVLRLNNDVKIELPTELSSADRVKFVNDIINKYPNEFIYNGDDMFTTRYNQKVDNNKLVKVKLDILATYVLRAEDKSCNIMSRYKETKRPLQELPFSQFKEEVQDIQGWY